MYSLGVVAHNSVHRLIGLQVLSCYSEDKVLKLSHGEQASGGGHGRQSCPLTPQTVQLQPMADMTVQENIIELCNNTIIIIIIYHE